MSATLTEIASLSIENRIHLVEAIWDTIAAEPDELKLTAAQKRELEWRLKAHTADPENVVPWEEVKSQALPRANK